MEFVFFNLIVILIIVLLLVFLSWMWPPNSPWAPWWKTDKKTAREICKLAKITRSDLVYELGCGHGTLIITAAKEFGAQGVGIEIDPLRFFISTIMTHIIKVSDKVTIKRKNFFDEDLSKATVIYVYLVPKALNQLLPKFKKELEKGTRVVTYKYPLNLKSSRPRFTVRGGKKSNPKENLFLYTI